MLKAREWRARKLHSAGNNLEESLSSLPARRVSSSGALLQYIQQLTPRLMEYVGHFGSMQHRNLAKKVSVCFERSSRAWLKKIFFDGQTMVMPIPTLFFVVASHAKSATSSGMQSTFDAT